MGLGDFILLIDKFGVFGLAVVFLFASVMFLGSLVDIYQFLWLIKRMKNRRKKRLREEIRAEILLELHQEEIRKKLHDK